MSRGRRVGARVLSHGCRDARGGLTVRRPSQEHDRQAQFLADARRQRGPAVLEPVLLGPGGEGGERRVSALQSVLGDEARREALLLVAQGQPQPQPLARQPEGVGEVRVLEAGAPGRGAVTGHGAGHQHPAALLRAKPDAHRGTGEPRHPAAAEEPLQIEGDVESRRPQPRAKFPKRPPERPPASGPDHVLPRGAVPDDDLVETLVMFDHATGVGLHRPGDVRPRIAASERLGHGRCQQYVAARGQAHQKDCPGGVREVEPRTLPRGPRCFLDRHGQGGLPPSNPMGEIRDGRMTHWDENDGNGRMITLRGRCAILLGGGRDVRRGRIRPGSSSTGGV